MTTRKKALLEIMHQFPIDILYAFGSQAKQVSRWLEDEQVCLQTDSADVDIGVKINSDAPFSVKDKVLLALALEQLFGVKRVDLVSLADADPFLAANIIRGERLFADDTYLADEYDLYILRRAGDLAPFERQRMALILGEE